MDRRRERVLVAVPEEDGLLDRRRGRSPRDRPRRRCPSRPPLSRARARLAWPRQGRRVCAGWSRTSPSRRLLDLLEPATMSASAGAPELAERLEDDRRAARPRPSSSGSRATAARSIVVETSSTPAAPPGTAPVRPSPRPARDPVAEHRAARERERTTARLAVRDERGRCPAASATRPVLAGDRRQAERDRLRIAVAGTVERAPAGSPELRGQCVGERRLQPARRRCRGSRSAACRRDRRPRAP